MAVKSIVKTSEYHDSVSLMLVARELSAMQGVQDAAVVMATKANKDILENAGLLTAQVEAATNNDLVIVVRGETNSLLEQALQTAEQLLRSKGAKLDSISPTSAGFRPKTIRGALASHPAINLAVISVAGRYAADEAWEALNRGLHVLLFSDNVSLEDEISLKQYARQHGLLLMGPGAGTTLLNGIALGFANVIPSGPVGIISAAGTGLQEVSSLLARYGTGITQGLGVGGRDLQMQVGGIMMLEALKALQDDPDTEVITLISKPPQESVADAVIEQTAASDKPCVVCFLGGDVDKYAIQTNIHPASTLQEAAWVSARLAGADLPNPKDALAAQNKALQTQADSLRLRLKENQRYLRGLFSGGTLCYEAQVIWSEMLREAVHSNAPLPGAPMLTDLMKSLGHTTLDLGEELFTVGRPHPMIDNDLRIRRLLQEAKDPTVGVIILDVVLGYGAHPDPAAELGPAIEEARQIARKDGRDLIVIASVVGTQGDPQGMQYTIARIEQAGAIVCESNAAAARLAGYLVSG